MIDVSISPQSSEGSGLAGLSEAELLVLWTVRKHLDGNGARLQRVLVLACGLARIEAALSALDGIAMLLRRYPRRPLRVHMMKCSRLSADERAFLTLVAAQQAGRAAHAAALASWLVAERSAELAAHAATIARILDERGYHLPPPCPVTPPRAVAYRAGWPRPVRMG